MKDEIEDCIVEDTEKTDYSWNEIGVCLCATQHSLVTAKKSMGYINYASNGDFWYVACSYFMNGGNCAGYGSGVHLDSKKYKTMSQAKQAGWIELREKVARITDHDDAPKLLEMVDSMINGTEQPELFDMEGTK